MFSSRTHWHLQPNRLTRLLEEKKRRGDRIIDLTASNPLQAGFDYPTDKILEALSKAESVSYGPDPGGLLSARQAISGYYAARHLHVDPAQILLTASTSEAYSFLFTLLCDSGENVLVPSPSYPLFEHLAQLSLVDTKTYELRYDGEWHIDFDSLTRAINPQTRAVIVVSPHNPTGMFLKHDELNALRNLLNRSHVALIIDEVFVDFGFADDVRRASSLIASEPPLAFVLNGISKLAGLPQLKLGWIVVSGRDELRCEAYRRLEMIADTYLSVNTPVQHALPDLLSLSSEITSQIRSRTIENFLMLKSLISDKSMISVLNTEGGWSAVLRIPSTQSEEDWATQLLENSGVRIYPGYFFDFPSEGFLVVSLLVEREVFAEGIAELVRMIR